MLAMATTDTFFSSSSPLLLRSLLDMGVARYVGSTSPAMTTSTFSSHAAGAWSEATSLAPSVAEPSSWPRPALPSRYPDSFQYEQARMRRAKAMSPSIAARPPKRYGTGECHAECAAPAARGATAAFVAAAVALKPAPGLIVSALLVDMLLLSTGSKYV
uniref:Uncharacterized protein n=1 Tax=Triticum urartu TaxID=4572 RepID=A0A8R7U550_TRIUA